MSDGFNSLTHRNPDTPTNFERVANVGAFQERFGYALASSFSVNSKERAYAALSKLAADVVSGRVHSREEFAEAKNMSGYFDEVEAFIAPPPPPSPPLPSPPSPSPNGASDSSNNGAPPTPNVENDGSVVNNPPPAPSPTPTPTPPPVRKKRTSAYLVDKKALLNVTNPKCRLVIDELKGKVKVTDSPFACALLVRSFQEMTSYIYLDAMGLNPGNNKTTNITGAANHLLGTRHETDTSDRQALAIAFKSSSDIYEQLSETAHSTVTVTGPDHVRVVWQNLSGGLELLWRRIHHTQLAAQTSSANSASTQGQP